MLYGQGAGGAATATAVLSDVVQIARGIGLSLNSPNAHLGFQAHTPLPLRESSRPRNWYLRLTFRDRPGILAQTAQAIAQEGINIEAVVQGLHVVKDKVSFAIMLEPVCESQAQKAVATLNQFDFMHEPVLILPMVSAAGE
jgi:homoserine dehydrogenase